MTKEEKLARLREVAPEWLNLLSIEVANHKPHPYMIGSKHVSVASDRYGSMLSKENIMDMEKNFRVYCEVPGCTLPFDQHTYNTLLFVQLTRNVAKEEAELPELGKLMEEMGIDGLTLVETEEKYRFVEK